ncbi:hypothetical protein K438DRAFT_1968451 [Mycena galopus ATCC 62051]|nr:hypothetical protein K438DRAFT_1968451 [Mycena galopus ATCC 62051]
MPMDEEPQDPVVLAAPHAAVQRSLDMIREANRQRSCPGEMPWFWDKTRATEVLHQYCLERLGKLRCADGRRSTRRRYLERRAKYAQQRGGAAEPPDDPAWGTAEWGSDQDWTLTDPSWQDPGFWMKPEDDNVSPPMIPRPLSLEFLRY